MKWKETPFVAMALVVTRLAAINLCCWHKVVLPLPFPDQSVMLREPSCPEQS